MKKSFFNIDVNNFYYLVRILKNIKFDVVVNCIGIIKQHKTAKDPIVSITLNALFPHKLAELCSLINAKVIHISTDCVFSGERGDYKEEDLSDARDLYGRTKFLGEIDYKNALTVRTSIIGRELTTSLGLLEWFLKQRGKTIRGFKNAIFTGFPTVILAEIIGKIILEHIKLRGFYQVSSEKISKYDLLSLINRVYDLHIDFIPDDDFHCDRSLDSTKFRQTTGILPPSWEIMIQRMKNDPTPYDKWRIQ